MEMWSFFGKPLRISFLPRTGVHLPNFHTFTSMNHIQKPYTLHNFFHDVVQWAESSLLWGWALLLGLALLWAPVATAQITFTTELTKEVQETLNERQDVDAGALYELLEEGVQLSIRSWEEWPVECRLLVFFVEPGGGLQGSLSSPSFEIESEDPTRGEPVSKDRFREQFEKLSGGNSMSPSLDEAQLDSDTVARMLEEFGDAETEDGWSKDYERAWAEVLAKGLTQTDAHGGVGLAMVPIIARYMDNTGDNTGEFMVRYVWATSRVSDFE